MNKNPQNTLYTAVPKDLEARLLKTLAKPPLDPRLVISACDKLIQTLDRPGILDCLPLPKGSEALVRMYSSQLKALFQAEALEQRLQHELGPLYYHHPHTLTYAQSQARARQYIMPLGVLFHIAAGNVDGLPFFSLVEGLLTGNINLLKLPSGEGGFTLFLLEALFKIAPQLQEYVYVFDFSSYDLTTMEKLARAADGIVLWGGDEAVRSVRGMAAPDTRIIEWGHKLSFAYVTKGGMQEKALEKLALHICLTNQLFCSACQGVFVDTEEMADVHAFCAAFLPVLEKTCQANPLPEGDLSNLFIQAEMTLQEYHQRMEGHFSSTGLYRGQHCSIRACADQKLMPSTMYRNLWARPLSRDGILKLHTYKGNLQTAALLCTKDEHAELSQKLLRAGLVKITDGLEMSGIAPGEAHDGLFPLRSYTRIVSVQES